MANDLAISSPPSTNYYHSQLPFNLPPERIRSRRSCVLQGRRCRVLSSARRCRVPFSKMLSVLLSAAPEGIRSSSFRVTNMASLRTSIPYLDKLHEGGIEPHLNGFSILAKAFELDSNRSNTPVYQVKILFQYQNLPPLNPTTNKIIDQQKILIGFGGGAEGGGGR